MIARDHTFIKSDLWIDCGHIVNEITGKPFTTLSFPEKLIVPGFIDTQINGAFGVDFTTQPENIAFVAKQLPQHGVTSFLCTVISSPPENYHKVIPQINLLAKQLPPYSANLIGIHLEGPFFNPAKTGAHPLRFIPQYNPINVDAFVNHYGTLENVVMVTLAPELPGALDIIEFLQKNGIRVAAGHSLADFNETQLAFKHGVKMATHLFNAMTPISQREPGIVGAVLHPNESPKVYYSLIADGIHVHPAMINIAWKTHPHGCILVSDGISTLGLSKESCVDQKFAIGFETVDLADSSNHIANSTTLAGGVTPLIQCLKNFIRMTRCSLIEAIDTVTLHPATLLGIEQKKGTLNIGSDADFLILDTDLNILSTFIGGRRYDLFRLS